ncbi:carbohydrate sulfotransferase 1-like [Amphiura filiformis]|uniref:carbohydrate sulfotransferase 1-like n=1 Tax=Amphiura filiformis TaxID=82378 RepID=UPI003B217AC9
MCLSYKGNVAMKTIRASIEDIKELLEENQQENIKIIHIVRDPRGVANSRKLLKIPASDKKALESYLHRNASRAKPSIRNLIQSGLLVPKSPSPRPTVANQMETVNDYCDHLHHDLQLAIHQHHVLRNRYKIIRYEDLAANPEIMTRKIYSFLGQSIIPGAVTEWLSDNTNVPYWQSRNENSMGLHKNSIETSSRWRRCLSGEELQQVQAVCADVMELLGYKLFATEKSLLDLTVPSTGFNTLGTDISIT